MCCGFKYPDTNPADHWHRQLAGENVEAWRAARYLCVGFLFWFVLFFFFCFVVVVLFWFFFSLWL